ncbi:MAG: DNA methylase [Parcubacteria group bacterium ADurb.Bin159]|jgi:tRNA (guanine10-N2)-dimethyltransferase|nr:MAG: DNA methylase [Parcubacteria group bacterium ADurb.Bin159]
MYFFILGHNFILSIGEIMSLVKKNFEIEEESKNVLILKCPVFDLNDFQKKLGGTIKLGEIKTCLPLTQFSKISPLIFSLLPLTAKKIYFGFSIYPIEETAPLKNFNQLIKDLSLKIKKDLKEKNISSRWVASKEPSLSSVVVKKNNLDKPEKGVEFVILVSKNKFYLGKTAAWQDFEKEKYFDFGRPSRPIKSGLLPPKLARLLINLSQVEKDEIILDPFCGSGTILSEAIGLGYKKIIGADINKKALNRTKENINWLTRQTKEKINFQLLLSDVQNISKKIPSSSIGAIITEPYLGPLKTPSSETKILYLISDLSHLYLNAFKEFRKILKPKAKVVIISPVFLLKNKKYFLPLKDKIKKQEWEIINPLKNSKKFNNVPLIYHQPDQKIWREILIFQKI